MSSVNSDTQGLQNLRTVYKELCNSYRAIDDFRTKLLGFLPWRLGPEIFFSDKAKIDFVQPYFLSYRNLRVCNYAWTVLL